MNEVICAGFLATGFENNSIFDLNHPRNRDNCLQPFWLMKEMFRQHGIDINTVDSLDGRNAAFELHMDVQNSSHAGDMYLLMLETAQVSPANGISSNRLRYKKVFTWNDQLVDGERFIKINFPNPIQAGKVDGFGPRDRFVCLIAGNKSLAQSGDSNLYPERVKAIRWFEKNAATDFDLYGLDWDRPVIHRGLIGRIERAAWITIGRFVMPPPFPSYRGKVKRKSDVLAKTRFSICYENVRDLPGYITEKIFDCFFSGCVPVYWGASNIFSHIPSDCFIDRRNFRDTAEVYTFLKAMGEEEYIGYQRRIADFLHSDAAYPFGADFFAETIVNTIVKDLGLQS